MEGHPLDLSDQTSEKMRWEHLDQMPGQGCSQGPADQDEQKVEKDLPEGAHARKTTTTPLQNQALPETMKKKTPSGGAL